MDATHIPLDLSGLYLVLELCAILLASFWALPKLVQLLKK